METPVLNYVIGDVHGCYGALRRLEEQAHRDARMRGGQARFILVGDLIDRGPDVQRCVEHVIEGVSAGTHVALAGNHEGLMFEVAQWCAPLFWEGHVESAPWERPLPLYGLGLTERFLRTLPPFSNLHALLDGTEASRPHLEELSRDSNFLDFVEKMRVSWMRQGGEQTLRAYDCAPDQPRAWRFPVRVRDFLFNLPLFYEGETFIVTHALAEKEDLDRIRMARDERIQSGAKATPLGPKRDPQRLAAIENVTWSRTLPKKPQFGTKVHVSGHTPQHDVVRTSQLGMILVDTGCAYGGKLSAWCAETGDVLSAVQ